MFTKMFTKKGISFIIILFLFVFINISCTSGEKNIKENEESKIIKNENEYPEWLQNYKTEDSNYYYFVGSSSEVDTENEGDNQALENIYKKIFSIIGLQVSSSMEKSDIYKTIGDEEEFKSVLKSFLKTSSKGKIKDIKIIDRYIKKLKNGKIVVFLYVSVPKDVIINEQKRLEKIYTEKINSFIIPEKKAQIALNKGDIYDAIINTVISTQNVSNTEYENKEIIIKKGIDRLYFISSKMKSKLFYKEQKFYRGESQKFPFVYKVYMEYNSKVYPVSNIKVKFFYKSLNTKGDIESYEFDTTTDEQGQAYFKYDKIPFSGKTFIIAFVDFSSNIESIIETINQIADITDEKKDIFINNLKQIKSNFNGLKIRKDIMFISKSLTYKTALIYKFMDDNNNILQNINTSNFEQYLSELQIPFTIAENGLNKDFETYLKNNKKTFLDNGFKRVIYVESRFISSKKYSGKIIAACNITIKVYYLEDDTFKTVSIKVTGNGDNINQAINASIFNGFKKLEKKLLLYL